MPDKDPAGPSLELPSFGFGRKRKGRQTVVQETEAPPPASERPTPEPAPEPEPDRPQRTAPLLGLGALPASLLTGIVVGLLTTLLGYGSQRLCEAVLGTSSCGGAGVPLLLAILLAMTVLGGALLRAFLVPDAGSASVLAMGLLAVLVMLFLIDAAFSPAMFVVIPVLAAGCYAVAHWVATLSTSTD